MKTLTLSILAAAAAIGLLGCNGPTVVQGSVVSFDTGTKQLVVKDERAPNAELTISAANADIGGEPKPGEVVRVAYKDEGGTLRATRVMNLSHQEDQRKGGGAH